MSHWFFSTGPGVPSLVRKMYNTEEYQGPGGHVQIGKHSIGHNWQQCYFNSEKLARRVQWPNGMNTKRTHLMNWLTGTWPKRFYKSNRQQFARSQLIPLSHIYLNYSDINVRKMRSRIYLDKNIVSFPVTCPSVTLTGSMMSKLQIRQSITAKQHYQYSTLLTEHHASFDNRTLFPCLWTFPWV